MSVFQEYRRQFNRLATRAVCLLWVAIALWCTAWVPQAAADSVGVGSPRAAEIMRERAANELNRTTGEGASDFIEGSVEGSVGKVKRSLGQLTDDVDTSLDGATEQLKGKVKRFDCSLFIYSL